MKHPTYTNTKLPLAVRKSLIVKDMLIHSNSLESFKQRSEELKESFEYIHQEENLITTKNET